MLRSILALIALACVGCDDGASTTPDAAAAVDASAPRDALAVDGADLAESAVRFAVIGDYGSDSLDEAHVAAMVASWQPDFVVTVGDNNYPSGLAATIDANIGKHYEEYIGEYHGAYGPGSSTNRFWPVPGNHDWYSGATPLGLQPYLDYFTALPGNRRYYDVELGPVHVFAVDSHDPVEGPSTGDPDGWTAGSVQGAWLRARLAASTSCYNLVFFHHPPYSSGMYYVPSMRWPFAAWGADAVLCGHEHFYERLAVDGIPYFNNGLGGEDRFAFATPDPHSQFRYDGDFGAMLVTATRTGITYEFWSVGGQKIDAITVAKSCP